MHNLILVIGEDRNSKSTHLPPTLPCSNIPNAVGDSIRSVECVQIRGKKKYLIGKWESKRQGRVEGENRVGLHVHQEEW